MDGLVNSHPESCSQKTVGTIAIIVLFPPLHGVQERELDPSLGLLCLVHYWLPDFPVMILVLPRVSIHGNKFSV